MFPSGLSTLTGVVRPPQMPLPALVLGHECGQDALRSSSLSEVVERLWLMTFNKHFVSCFKCKGVAFQYL